MGSCSYIFSNIFFPLMPLFDAEFVVLHSKIICLFILSSFSYMCYVVVFCSIWKFIINFCRFPFHLSISYRILVGAPLGRNPQPQTNRTGTLKKCPMTQRQSDCEDVFTDGRLSEFTAFSNFDELEISAKQISMEIKLNRAIQKVEEYFFGQRFAYE